MASCKPTKYQHWKPNAVEAGPAMIRSPVRAVANAVPGMRSLGWHVHDIDVDSSDNDSDYPGNPPEVRRTTQIPPGQVYELGFFIHSAGRFFTHCAQVP